MMLMQPLKITINRYFIMKLFSYLLVVLSLLSWSAADAQGPTNFTLNDAVDFALNNNLTIRNAVVNIADAEQQIIERRAAGVPQVNLAADYNYYIDIPTSILPPFFPEQDFTQVEDINGALIPITFTRTDPETGEPIFGDPQEIQFGLRHNINGTFQVQTLLFDASYLTGLRAARAYRTYVQEELTSKRREVRLQVIDAYLPTLIVQENMAILDSNLSNVNQLLFEAEESYKAGFVEQLDVDRLELSLANLQTQKEQLDRQLEILSNVLKLAMNYPTDRPIQLTDDLDDLLDDETLQVLAAEVNYDNRPEIRVLDKAIELNQLNVELNQAAYFPSVAGFFTYRQTFQGNDFSTGAWFPTTLVGLTVNYPLFTGFRRQAMTERAKLGLEITQNQREQFRQVINMEVENARTSYLNAKERLSNQQRNLDLAERIYRVTRIKYQEGVGGSVELAQAEQSLYATQSNYVQARYDLLQAQIELRNALGLDVFKNN